MDEVYRIALGKSALRQQIKHRVAMNIDTAVQWTRTERNAVWKTVLSYAERHFSPEEIHDLVGVTVKREEAQNLQDIAGLPGISFEILKRRVADFCKLPRTIISLPPSDLVATRVALMRQFVSDHIDFLTVARNYVQVRDLDVVAQRIIGPREGMGRIGGKAAGLLLADKILRQHYQNAGREPLMPLKTPDSYYLRSDLNDEFVRRNGLMEYASQKYKSQEAIEADYPLLRELFHAGSFPPEVVSRIRKLLEKLGPTPLIVRSSSLLEDSLGAAFSGKYRSIFLANQGSLSNRLIRFLSAVKEVYAGVLSADPLVYRRERDLIDYDEFMAILIQPVVGRTYRHYYFPLFAGVAFSRNDYYRWDRRIRREDGLVRLVAGLGTRAVDRVSAEYPRMIALTVPSLRPQGDVDEICRQSQRRVDVVNLRTNRFETLNFTDAIEAEPPPNFDLVASIVEEEALRPIVGNFVDTSRQSICLTFDKLIESTPFAPHMREVLSVLEKGYGCPVDIEFASDGKDFYLLQCRPLAQKIEASRVRVPTDVEPKRVLFNAQRDVMNGIVRNIEYIVYVPAEAYDDVSDLTTKQMIGRVVGQLNQKLHGSRFILLGPGRWGSNDINLGVRVNYADIRNSRALIEVAHEKDGYVPEVSFGTHFFQDLVESGISYLPLYPDEPGGIFNADFLLNSPNRLPKLLPNHKSFAPIVRAIHVPEVAEGEYAHLLMDGENELALCYLGPMQREEASTQA